MSEPKWNSGPPPSIGWWPTRAYCTVIDEWEKLEDLRWWDGCVWSVYCDQADADQEKLNRYSRIRAMYRPGNIEWTDRPASWPARSRT